MKPYILDGKKYAKQITIDLKKQAKNLKKQGVVSGLAVILAGNDPASLLYVNNKRKKAEEIGINFQLFHITKNCFLGNPIRNKYTSSGVNNYIINLIKQLNNDPSIHGIVVQLPLSAGLDTQKIIKAITPAKNVDILREKLELFPRKQFLTTSPTVKAVIYLLTKALKLFTPLKSHLFLTGFPRKQFENNINKKGLKAIIFANSALFAHDIKTAVHKLGIKSDTQLAPANKLTKKPIKTLINKGILANYDIYIVAKGYPHIIKENMVKQGAIVIDVGTTIVTSHKSQVASNSQTTGAPERLSTSARMVVGDVDPAAYPKLRAYSPVPGGVGPLTVIFLMENTIKLAQSAKIV